MSSHLHVACARSRSSRKLAGPSGSFYAAGHARLREPAHLLLPAPVAFFSWFIGRSAEMGWTRWGARARALSVRRFVGPPLDAATTQLHRSLSAPCVPPDDAPPSRRSCATVVRCWLTLAAVVLCCALRCWPACPLICQSAAPTPLGPYHFAFAVVRAPSLLFFLSSPFRLPALHTGLVVIFGDRVFLRPYLLLAVVPRALFAPHLFGASISRLASARIFSWALLLPRDFTVRVTVCLLDARCSIYFFFFNTAP